MVEAVDRLRQCFEFGVAVDGVTIDGEKLVGAVVEVASAIHALAEAANDVATQIACYRAEQ